MKRRKDMESIYPGLPANERARDQTREEILTKLERVFKAIDVLKANALGIRYFIAKDKYQKDMAEALQDVIEMIESDVESIYGSVTGLFLADRLEELLS